MKRWWLLVPAVVLLGLLWYLRTWWHTPVMFLYARPEFLQGVVLSTLISVLVLPRLGFLTRQRTMKVTVNQAGKSQVVPWHFRWLPAAAVAVFLVLVPMFMIAGSWGRALALAEELEYLELSDLPASGDQPRLMPYEVAHRYARDSLQLSQYRLGTESLVLVDGHLSWVFPLVPDGFVLKFVLQNRGVIVVDATTEQKNARLIERSLAVGEGMQITDNLWWNLFRSRYFVTTEYPYYIPHGDDVLTVVPAVTYQFRLRWGIVHTVPRFDGLFLVTGDGTVSWLDHDEAKAHPALENNRVFPELLSREYVLAHRFRGGLANYLFIHEDKIQIQDVPSAVQINRQPFLVNTERGLVWFVGTEPHGASHGIFKIFLVDAVTGDLHVLNMSPGQALTGPARAAAYVRRANPIVDWSRFNLVEPLPVMLDGVLYWKLAVIPEDAAGIAYQAFVDSETNRVYSAETDEEVARFLAGGPVGRPEGPSTTDVIAEILARLQELEELVRRLEGE